MLDGNALLEKGLGLVKNNIALNDQLKTCQIGSEEALVVMTQMRRINEEIDDVLQAMRIVNNDQIREVFRLENEVENAKSVIDSGERVYPHDVPKGTGAGG